MIINIIDSTDNEITSVKTKIIPSVNDLIRFDGENEGNKLRKVITREFTFDNNKLWEIVITVDLPNKC